MLTEKKSLYQKQIIENKIDAELVADNVNLSLSVQATGVKGKFEEIEFDYLAKPLKAH